MAKNYYEVLGVSKNATDKEIRQAYRKLARKYHPDINPGSKAAEARFKGINEAYQVLSNADSRRKYDQFGDNWKYADQFSKASSSADGGQGQPFEWHFGAGADLGDLGFGLGDTIFDRFFGRGRPGTRTRSTAQQQVKVEVSLEEALAGTTRLINIAGQGRKRRLEVKIPPGVDNGSKVRVSTGNDSVIVLEMSVASHAHFERRGQDLYASVQVPLYDAVLGGEASVNTLDGKQIVLKIPPETQNGRTFRVAGKGMPRLGAQKEKGDLFVRVQVVLPSGLSQNERDLFQKLKAVRR